MDLTLTELALSFFGFLGILAWLTTSFLRQLSELFEAWRNILRVFICRCECHESGAPPCNGRGGGDST